MARPADLAAAASIEVVVAKVCDCGADGLYFTMIRSAKAGLDCVVRFCALYEAAEPSVGITACADIVSRDNDAPQNALLRTLFLFIIFKFLSMLGLFRNEITLGHPSRLLV